MLPVFLGSAVRAAEAPAIAAAAAAGDPERYIARAAHGLASVILRHLGAAGLPAPEVSGPVPVRREVRVLGGAGVRGRRVVAWVGPGNNGADGLHALSLLAARGAEATAVLVTERHHEPGAARLRAAGGRVLPASGPAAGRALARAEILIDAALGTGANGGIDLPGLEAGRPRVPASAWRIACDVPSGLDADHGEADPSVPAADTTVTFGELKAGLLLGRGRSLAGELRLVRLPGLLDPALLGDPAFSVLSEREAMDSVLSPRPEEHKYSRGVLGLVAGSPAYPGAAVLAAHAALATGVGMLSAFTRGTARLTFSGAIPEAVVSRREDAPDGAAASRVNAWLVGPGLGDEPEDLDAARRVLATDAPVVVDASALAVVAPSAEPSPVPRLLTPHAGELRALARRLGADWPDPLTRPVAAATAAAKALCAVVLLKGSTTLVAAPDGGVLAACSAGPELAVAGSGDTLAGLLGALLATHAARAAAEGRPLDAAELQRLGAAGAVLHGLAATRAPGRGAEPLAAGLRELLGPR
ncbi:NAD(P)H-hydrate dehydratase [Galactobacter valiniphilus]|uniref:ADP-dependent (S)-NAD(P)H-hydrate dehydratase n=1 Tax=Galactobacter valiniphilus TaxID=2676122 RepID=A0A399JFR4_9MICC|nr:NAD(P)H-hydrate dehydratase [Galactobacter valiniphilus]RII43437.1 NAD(P)H-hydrate dehydratase [Galactobacter valiniphilus]